MTPDNSHDCEGISAIEDLLTYFQRHGKPLQLTNAPIIIS